jgi:hypothetical protein
MWETPEVVWQASMRFKLVPPELRLRPGLASDLDLRGGVAPSLGEVKHNLMQQY